MKVISAHCCAICWRACCCSCACSSPLRRSSSSSARSGARCNCGADPMWLDLGVSFSPSPTSSSSCSRSRSFRRAPTKACLCWRRSFPVVLAIAAWAVIPVADGWVGQRYQCRHPVPLRGFLAWRIRHHHGGLGVQFEISAALGAAFGRADGVLRSLDRLRHRHRGAVRGLAQPHRTSSARRIRGSACSAGTGCRCCRCSSSSLFRRSPRRTGRRST